VSRLRLRLSISLDGYAAGPNHQQYLNAGLLDEMQLHIVPILLGSGERLFDGVKDLQGLALVKTVAAPNVTHLKFVRA
jgi:dihydrofolate reductase